MTDARRANQQFAIGLKTAGQCVHEPAHRALADRVTLGYNLRGQPRRAVTRLPWQARQTSASGDGVCVLRISGGAMLVGCALMQASVRMALDMILLPNRDCSRGSGSV